MQGDDPSAYANWHDLDLKRNFVSCPDMAAMPEEFWTKSQPDNYKGAEDVVAFHFNPDNLGYIDGRADNKLAALCEVNTQAK